MSKKVSSEIGVPSRVRPIVSATTVIKIYNALIQLRFDYFSIVFGMEQATNWAKNCKSSKIVPPELFLKPVMTPDTETSRDKFHWN